jgi:hypothetical protein
MKKLTLTNAVFMALAATSVCAHHAAVDNAPTEVYSMIEENLEGTPHADMDLEMAIIGDTAGNLAGTANTANNGWTSNQYEQGTPSREQPAGVPGPSMDTMVLFEDLQ